MVYHAAQSVIYCAVQLIFFFPYVQVRIVKPTRLSPNPTLERYLPAEVIVEVITMMF